MNEINEHAVMEYGCKCHRQTNHTYDGQPYADHLKMVRDIADEFLSAVPLESRPAVRAACWVHDVIEDARQTYEDVRKVCGDEVADIAYALTHGKGRTREERMGAEYFSGIRKTPGAAFVKICDRLANVRYSASWRNKRKLAIYRRESSLFESELYSWQYKEMFDELRRLLEDT